MFRFAPLGLAVRRSGQTGSARPRARSRALRPIVSTSPAGRGVGGSSSSAQLGVELLRHCVATLSTYMQCADGVDCSLCSSLCGEVAPFKARLEAPIASKDEAARFCRHDAATCRRQHLARAPIQKLCVYWAWHLHSCELLQHTHNCCFRRSPPTAPTVGKPLPKFCARLNNKYRPPLLRRNLSLWGG